MSTPPVLLCPHCAHYHQDTCRHLAPGETDPCGCER